MVAHPLALQLRNLQTLVELGVDKNTTVVFPAPLMSAIGDIGAFFAREAVASTTLAPTTQPLVTHPTSPMPTPISMQCPNRHQNQNRYLITS